MSETILPNLTLDCKCMNGIEFYRNEDKPKAQIMLRGQPTEDSSRTVCRANFLKGKWDVNGAYTWGAILSSESFDVSIENSTNCTALNLFSESKGWIKIPIINGDFVIGENTKFINRDRKYKFSTNDIVLDTPKDITKCYIK